MRVLFTSLRNTGHFLPLVPFIESCRRRGHEVAVAAPTDLAGKVTPTGATFLPFGHPGDAALGPIWARLREASTDEGNRIVVSEIFAGACAGAALPALLDGIDRFRPDLIVRESQEYAAVIAAEARGIPHARVSISLQHVERALHRLAAPALDAHRSAQGLPPDPTGEQLRGAPVLTLFPPSLESPDPSPAGTVHRFRAIHGAPSPLPDWWQGRREPLVYVTLGTVAGDMETTHAAYRAALEATSALPLRVLITTGSDLPPGALGQLPPSVHVESFVPQHDVLQEATLVLCHGGSGTVLGALGAGVPLVVTPLFADQPHNAERVAATGAGLSVPPAEASVTGLREAVKRVLSDDAFRRAARRVRDEIASLPPTDEAAERLESMTGA